jgi:hypothetical protein
MDIIFHGRGLVGIQINDQVSPNFQTIKGVRHEDPLSPTLINIVVDIFAISKNTLQENGMFSSTEITFVI